MSRPGPRLALRLALRDMAREPAHVLGVVALIAGVLAPLMLLFAIKAGVMGAVVDALRADPNMRRIAITGNHAFTQEDLARLRGWPEIAFIAPQERSLARRLEARPPEARAYERAGLMGTEPGDPLLPEGLEIGPGQVALSPALARKWGVGPGARIELRAARGSPPTARMRLEAEVVHVLAPGRVGGDVLVVPTGFVHEVEAFYDGHALPAYGAPDGPPLEGRVTRYENFRIYARSIEDVGPLALRLSDELGVTVQSREGEIAPLLGLEKDVGTALGVLAVCAGLGLACALASLFWSNVERKQGALAFLALIGLGPRALALFTLAQACAYALAGWLAASAIVAGGSAALEAVFAGRAGGSGPIAPLDPAVFLGVGAGVLAVALVAAAAAARRAAATDPAIAVRAGG
ncbi:hypothetical protein ACQ5SO_14375 [Rhodovulum sp. DZ06]|uniref:hypothetical protein n=1 Tax=Rhodovulum sp. DZ06 TaxID=3425126 RepID=UPI003D325280